MIDTHGEWADDQMAALADAGLDQLPDPEDEDNPVNYPDWYVEAEEAAMRADDWLPF
ncbi:MAG TPA: hypothetical protein VNZ58_06615 [Thermomicrobiales bacterium]|nr:hypothetical protein [Thermomicrobiales bacterium]